MGSLTSTMHVLPREIQQQVYAVYFIKMFPVDVSSTIDWVGKRVAGLSVKSA